MRLPFSLYFVLLKFQKGCLFIQTARITCQTAVRSDNSVTGNYYRDGIMSDGTSDYLSRHMLSTLLICDDICYLAIGHCLSVRYRKKYVVHYLSERCCVQTYRRCEARLFSAEINIEPFDGFGKYRSSASVLSDMSLWGKYFCPSNHKPVVFIMSLDEGCTTEGRGIVKCVIHAFITPDI